MKITAKVHINKKTGQMIVMLPKKKMKWIPDKVDIKIPVTGVPNVWYHQLRGGKK